MKKYIALTMCLAWAYWGIAQSTQRHASSFNLAYKQHPAIPQGLLEAVAYSKTRLKNLDPQQVAEGCSGLPLYSGIMGLIDDGKGYFKNTLDLVASKSSFDKKAIILSVDNSILAYAEAFAQVQSELNITSNSLSANIPVLRFLSELPTQTGGQLYAQDAEIYQILKFLEDQDFMYSVNRNPYQVDFQTVFGQNNFQVLSSKKVTFAKSGISNSQNKTYQPNNQLLCIDYPGALWVAADPSNYS
ncbi:MAG: hypothetical protein JKX74_02745, partial [Flavobacteriales bacterium]|nr:hypothetical protein [Flavobacteriales bacterium]